MRNPNLATVAVELLTSGLGFCSTAHVEQGAAEALTRSGLGGDLEQVQDLLDKGADIKAAHLGLGHTAVISAAQEGCVEVVRELLKNRGNVNCSELKGATALSLASENGYTKVVKPFKAYGAKK